jgi:hypothetical protein
MTKIVPTDNEGLIQRYTEILWRISEANAETLLPPWSIAINLERSDNLAYGQICNFSKLGGVVFGQLHGFDLHTHKAGSWIWA